MNCRHRSCFKCGKLLNFKNKQSVRLAKFRAKAQQWAKTTVRSRNQSKVLDNLAIMMEKLKALGYVPLLLLGKCSKAHKWTAEVQCPFEFPAEGHMVMEKMLILFEHILQGLSPEEEQEVTEANQLSTWQQRESANKRRTQNVHSILLWTYFQWNLYRRRVSERDVKRCWCIACLVHPVRRHGHPPGSLKIMFRLLLINVNYITGP
ncbi:uncharacterized protein LOC143738564 [Siphateles boraxobius]|uniref:uncharacterized protein LOC143738564 n=1 Tax=Siphateles boraxobius TaxID=180520 RepID=UPI004062CB57